VFIVRSDKPIEFRRFTICLHSEIMTTSSHGTGEYKLRSEKVLQKPPRSEKYGKLIQRKYCWTEFRVDLKLEGRDAVIITS
jgi:hypothetical protein